MERVAPALTRTSSTMSVSSTTSTESRESRTCTKGNITYVSNDPAKRTRRRFTHAQLSMLETLYHDTSHPSREQRERVAADGAMEIKSVTIWFQNKRQTERRMAVLLAKDATRGEHLSSSESHLQKAHSTGSILPRPSLERVASLSELRVPRTPRARREPGAMPWDNMLSSPAGPTSPAARESEYVDFGGARARTLEWACARRRVRRRSAPQSDDTDIEEPHEAITPRSSMSIDGAAPLSRMPTLEEVIKRSDEKHGLGPVETKQSTGDRGLANVDEEDWKAALVLCGLGRS
ncbi:hypothetical protein BD626DRAFT_580537 [Schizophyllum amplum]|uniref:Homeobox domain-containing protein n=1 Tax=Schizophyllum amplum TaxID=97359 RepID=A0A550D0G2_9AGAR|nr:hypothetical protein BD626DRAFT_580537 [Auriculariopsis ampla]